MSSHPQKKIASVVSLEVFAFSAFWCHSFASLTVATCADYRVLRDKHVILGDGCMTT